MNVVSKCWVKVIDIAGFVTVEPVIYLKPQQPEGRSESFQEFENVFLANAFIKSHVLPGTRVEVAA
ncbi:hypothetical protein UFOVP1351_50 [uncultured Caudovirales phage]|uniref:Uncharacterized protein n=1 Tax=uncultured Caudovirales phage TaxID=2100421 RepID=A0A6J5S3V9_9CAUD|nr:hypothetical protein UFOVP1351_50 [uncultured Caudovirales phage]